MSDTPLHHCCSFTAWIFYGITLSGLIYLKIKKPELPRPYRVSVTHIHNHYQTHMYLSLLKLHENQRSRLSLSPQVPIILPILVLLAAICLVLAPIIDNPKIEYLYVTLFIFSGTIIYIPFVHYKLCPNLLTKLTVFLQLFLEVAPADKNL